MHINNALATVLGRRRNVMHGRASNGMPIVQKGLLQDFQRAVDGAACHADSLAVL